VVATLIRVTGDWDLAEECAQDALAAALERWPVDGIPRTPGAWLTTVARHRAIDRLRRAKTGAAKYLEVATVGSADGSADPSQDDGADDLLRLMFTCCHPALSVPSQVALTLRTVAGMTTPEIARAFLLSEATMAQRLVRAKRKIRHAGIPFRIPPPHQLVERTGAVLSVLYLLFNEGYSASHGTELVRPGLCEEAIRLARMLSALMPDEPEALGLLALMVLQHARHAARIDSRGDLVLLEQQDRTSWDGEAIGEGCALVESALRQRRAGPFQVQAAIAACHAQAAEAGDTDWAQIAALYERLSAMVPSPVVELNRAVAVGMAEGPDAGLAQLDQLAAMHGESLKDYYLFPAVRADLLRRLGRDADAAVAYREALALVTTEAERRYLARRHAEVAASLP